MKDLGRRPDSDRYGHSTAETAWAVWQARAALASAPDTSEADASHIVPGGPYSDPEKFIAVLGACAPVDGEATDAELDRLYRETITEGPEDNIQLWENPHRFYARAVLSRYAAPQASEAVALAVLRYERGMPGKENEMPRVVSCNWLPDGEYPVYATPQTSEGVPTGDVNREHTLREIIAALILENDDDAITAETLASARAAIYQPYRTTALSAQPGAQKYWLCCGSKDPNHSNRREPDCFNAAKAKWGTADQHSTAQKKGGSDAN